jgi:hypothetical protein
LQDEGVAMPKSFPSCTLPGKGKGTSKTRKGAAKSNMQKEIEMTSDDDNASSISGSDSDFDGRKPSTIASSKRNRKTLSVSHITVQAEASSDDEFETFQNEKTVKASMVESPQLTTKRKSYHDKDNFITILLMH